MQGADEQTGDVPTVRLPAIDSRPLTGFFAELCGRESARRYLDEAMSELAQRQGSAAASLAVAHEIAVRRKLLCVPRAGRRRGRSEQAACGRTPELLASRATGELAEADRQELAQHLSACPSCRAAELRLSRADRAHGAISRFRAAAETIGPGAVVAAAAPEPEPTPEPDAPAQQPKRRRRLGALPIAIALALLAACGAGAAVLIHGGSSHHNAATATETRASTPAAAALTTSVTARRHAPGRVHHKPRHKPKPRPLAAAPASSVTPAAPVRASAPIVRVAPAPPTTSTSASTTAPTSTSGTVSSGSVTIQQPSLGASGGKTRGISPKKH